MWNSNHFPLNVLFQSLTSGYLEFPTSRTIFRERGSTVIVYFMLFVHQAYSSYFRFAYSLLQCLRVLYKEKIIHCDLKPVNDFSYLVLELFPIVSSINTITASFVSALMSSLVHTRNKSLTKYAFSQS